MSRGDNSYRNILKGASIFGGVQVLQILISLIRGKFVAIFLGPAGMGMSALFNSTADVVRQFSSLGLNLAIVKEVAAVKDNPVRLSAVAEVARRMVYLTALLGGLVCLAFSGLLSCVAFGDFSQRWWMMLLAVPVFLGVAWQGEMSVLQGLHRVKVLSRASITGSLAGLFAGVPLYWLFGTRGIVPALIVYAAVMLIFYTVALRRILGPRDAGFVWREHVTLVRRLLSMGVVLMCVMAFTTLTQYLLNAWVQRTGSLTDVGLWQAANSLTMQYAEVVFMGMGMDYLPRLSACISDGRRFHTVVNRQTEIVTIAMAPMAAWLILAAPLVVHLLLDSAFEPCVPLVRVMCLALVARSTMYPLGFVTLAKDNRKVYFWMEAVGCNLLTLTLNGIGFMCFGLIGIGYAMVVDCLICLILYWVVNRRLYDFTFSRGALGSILLALVAGVMALGASYLPQEWMSYGIMTLTAILFTVIAVFRIRRLLHHKNDE